MQDLLNRLNPRRLLMVSVAVALLTIALKTSAWVLTGSVGMLSDALESLVNLASAIFGLAMVTVAPENGAPGWCCLLLPAAAAVAALCGGARRALGSCMRPG